jgi:hypothetical protein
MGTAIEEADESGFWLEVLVEAEIVAARITEALYREADELTRILVASRETARRNSRGRTLAGEPGRHESRFTIRDSRLKRNAVPARAYLPPITGTASRLDS